MNATRSSASRRRVDSGVARTRPAEQRQRVGVHHRIEDRLEDADAAGAIRAARDGHGDGRDGQQIVRRAPTTWPAASSRSPPWLSPLNNAGQNPSSVALARRAAGKTQTDAARNQNKKPAGNHSAASSTNSLSGERRTRQPTQARALRNMRIHGESSPHSRGAPRHLHAAEHALGMRHQHRSTRPSAAVNPAMPLGEPFGLSG